MSEILPDGVYSGLAAQRYHALPRWGSSSLKAMRKGPPARVQWEAANHASTDAQALGTAIHCALLEPVKFLETYWSKPEGMSFATKEGKEWRRLAEDANASILSFDDACAVQAMLESLHGKMLVSEALMSPRREVSLLWTDELTGEACKGRVDILGDDYVYDLKMSRYASPNMSYRSFVEGWMHQAAHYREGARRLGLTVMGARLIVVSSSAPHYVYTLEVKPDALDLVQIENSQTIYALGECRKTEQWPGTPDEWMLVEPPPNALIASTVIDSLDALEETE